MSNRSEETQEKESVLYLPIIHSLKNFYYYYFFLEKVFKCLFIWLLSLIEACRIYLHCSTQDILVAARENSKLRHLQSSLKEMAGGSVGSVCLQCGRPGFNPWVGKIPWRRKWQPTPVLLPGKSHGLRSLAGYSPWGRKESDTTERLSFLPDQGWNQAPCFGSSES